MHGFVSALFYFTLGNIRPKLRSSLKCIHLIACVTYPNLQNDGFQKVLQPFIDDVNALSKVRTLKCPIVSLSSILHNTYTQGVRITIRRNVNVVKGAVLSLLADTQAAHSIGGYKIGVGFALRKCRDCLATKDSMSTMVRVYNY